MARRASIVYIACLVLVAACAARAGASDPAPADPQPQWWKGNLHTHTLWSDGNDFPEMVADWYREQGYQFLAISDHNVLNRGLRWMPLTEITARNPKKPLDRYRVRFGPEWVETRGDAAAGSLEVRLKPLSEYRALVESQGEFLLLEAEEITDRAEGLPVHLNATNLELPLPPLGGATVRDAIAANVRAVDEQARRLGREMLVHLNHPNFGLAVTAEDLAAVIAEQFVEVYNGHPGVRHLGDEHHPSMETMWDIAITLRLAELAAPPPFGIATDDSHHYEGTGGSRPGRGWVVVRARRLTPESLIRAMKQGDFYASSGVALADVSFDEQAGRLALQIEPIDGAAYTTTFIGTPIAHDATSEPRLDADGQPIRATRKYSADVGKVLAIVEGLAPEYTLTGDELYVRAMVASSQPHADPSFAGQRQQAWTQPVGWRERLSAAVR